MWRIPSLFASQLLAYDIAIEFFEFFSYEFLSILLKNNCTVAYPDFFGILLQQGVSASKKRKLLCRTSPQKGPLSRGKNRHLVFVSDFSLQNFKVGSLFRMGKNAYPHQTYLENAFQMESWDAYNRFEGWVKRPYPENFVFNEILVS